MNKKPTYIEALSFAQENRFPAPSIRGTKELLEYICTEVRRVSLNSIKHQITFLNKNCKYPGQNYSVLEKPRIYCSEFVSDMYNINLFLREGGAFNPKNIND